MSYIKNDVSYRHCEMGEAYASAILTYASQVTVSSKVYGQSEKINDVQKSVKDLAKLTNRLRIEKKNKLEEKIRVYLAEKYVEENRTEEYSSANY